MSDKSSGAASGGILGVVFITLKLCKVIDWDWLWVTIPLWGGIALFIVVFVVAVVLTGIGTLLERKR